MRLTILAALLAGLIAGLVGALIIVVALDNGDDSTVDALTALETRIDSLREAQQAAAARDDLEALVETVRPAVVLITTEFTDGVDDQGRTIARGAIGTGVILDDAGHVLTNEHVVRDALRIELRFHDGSIRTAELIGDDSPFTDLAVLRTDPDGLTPAVFAPSGALRLGDPVFSFGNALGNGAALARGIVSNPDARFFGPDQSDRQDYVQTDAAVNPGNSGGPLLNDSGAVVGLVTQVVTSTSDGQVVQGVGFALGTDRVLPIAERIIAEDGDFPRPDFGVVEQQSLDDFIAEQLGTVRTEGAFIIELLRSSVFADAGVRPGDVIISLNGFTLTHETPYFHVLQQLPPDRAVDVVYVDEAGEEHLIEVVPVLRRR